MLSIGHLLTAFLISLAIFLLFRRQVGIHLEKLASQVTGEDKALLASPLQLEQKRSYQDELTLLVNSMNRMREMLHDDIRLRETIIREAHHRIKNDMTFIQSLLLLQAEQSEAPEMEKALQEAGKRIFVVTRIYQSLYRDEQVDQVEAGTTVRAFPRRYSVGPNRDLVWWLSPPWCSNTGGPSN